MKRINIIQIATSFALSLVSCTTTGYVVSDNSYEQTGLVIKEALSNRGYYQTGKTTSVEYDGTINTTYRERTTANDKANVTGQKSPYDNSVTINGNGNTNVRTNSSETTTMGRYYIDRYNFESESGDSVEYLVSYYKTILYDKLSKQNVVVLQKVSLVGCTTSNKKEWSDVCGDGGIVARNVKQPEKQQIEVEDDVKTLTVGYGILLGLIGVGGIYLISIL